MKFLNVMLFDLPSDVIQICSLKSLLPIVLFDDVTSYAGDRSGTDNPSTVGKTNC